MAWSLTFFGNFLVRNRRCAFLFGLAFIAQVGFLSACSVEAGPGTPEGPGATYYVAINGDNSYDGLSAAYEGGSRGPFRTLGRAAAAVKAGDTVEIRAGTYSETTVWSSSGTEALPITVKNYGEESVLLSGNGHTVPAGRYSALITIKGQWVNVRNLSVGYSSWYGLAVSGEHCTVDNVISHHNWSSGIVINGSHGLVVNCKAHNNSLINEYFRPHEGTWGFGISACRHPEYTTIRSCAAWDNWGEGISTFESTHTTIEDCTSYNNQQNFYLSDTKYCLFQRNLSYYTPGNMIQAYDTQCAILVGNEGHAPACSDNTIINNICLGGERNLAIGSNTFENSLVAHNTFVNASGTAGADSANVWINSGTYKNARFLNNIVLQEDGVAISRIDVRGVTFSHNNWSRTPVIYCRGTGDVTGDPRLSRSGPTDPGTLTADWFKILGSSPAKDRATSLAEVPEDRFKTARGNAPDIGAHEIASGLVQLIGR